jgi:hypothetical protein
MAGTVTSAGGGAATPMGSIREHHELRAHRSGQRHGGLAGRARLVRAVMSPALPRRHAGAATQEGLRRPATPRRRGPAVTRRCARAEARRRDSDDDGLHGVSFDRAADATAVPRVRDGLAHPRRGAGDELRPVHRVGELGNLRADASRSWAPRSRGISRLAGVRPGVPVGRQGESVHDHEATLGASRPPEVAGWSIRRTPAPGPRPPCSTA